MTRWVPLIAVLILSLSAARASASLLEPISLHLDVGAGFAPNEQRYIELSKDAFAVGGGIGVVWGPRIHGMLSVDRFRYSPDGPAVTAPGIDTHWDASTVTTALLGLELQASGRGRPGPYFMGAAGFGRIAIGDKRVLDMGGTRLVRGDRVDRPAFALGAGFRTRGLLPIGPSLEFSFRWIRLTGPSHGTTIMPLMVGVAF